MGPAYPRMMHICFHVRDDVDFNKFIADLESRDGFLNSQAAWSRAHSTTCAWVANQTPPLALACRINSSRIQIRER
jgi:hypothetical protein